MKGTFKVLMGLGVAAVIVAVAMPTSLAQCPTSREFGAQGNGGLTGRIKIDTSVNNFPNDGNELASFWQTEDPTKNNGGPHFGGDDTLCPAATWYQTGGMFLGTLSGIQGFIASPTCQMTACPDVGGSLSVLVEDTTADGTQAGFIYYQTQETPSFIRWYDHCTTVAPGQPGSCGTDGTFATHVFQLYPGIDVVSSTGSDVTNAPPDGSGNVHVSVGGVPSPEGLQIETYDICSFIGTQDPGRLRSAYTSCTSFPYDPAGMNQTIPNGCQDIATDEWLAVGLTYSGGLESAYVSGTTAVECDPNIADPDKKPKRPKVQRRPQRAGGR